MEFRAKFLHIASKVLVSNKTRTYILQAKNEAAPQKLLKNFARIGRIFQNSSDPLLPNNDNIDNSNNDNNMMIVT